MASLNSVHLIGRVGRDPEVRYFQDGTAVGSFSLATSESWKGKDGQKQERTQWHKIQCFRKLAEIVGQYVKKGSLVYVEGKITYREWEKDGQKRVVTEIEAGEIQFLDSKPKGQTQDSYRPPETQREPPPMPDDSDIPF